MTYLVRIAIPLFVLFSLTACGGGGGGGPTPVSLTGTVTDTTQAAVAGAQITVTDAATGDSIASATSDAAGRYSLRGLPTGTALRVEAAGEQGYFPMSAVVTLVSDGASLLDISLPSTRDKATKTIQFGTIANGATGGAVISSNTIGSGETAILTVPAGSLQDASGAAYLGSAEIYLAPLEVGKLGTGFAPYQVVLPAFVGDSYPAAFPDEILELYASAAVDMIAADGSDLVGDETSMDMPVLTMPVPVAPAFLRTSAAAQLEPILWRYDPATTAWIEMAATPIFDEITNTFSADIGMSGLYAVGVTSPATSISGRLLYSDSTTPAAGVSVYVTGVDAAYQQTTNSDSNGNFSALVKDSGQAKLDFIGWGYGLQLSGSDTPSVDLSTDPDGLGDVTLAYAMPVKGVSSPAVVQLVDTDMSAPVTTGIILSSGRLFVATTSGGATDTLATAEIADVVLVAEDFDFIANAGPVVNLVVGESGTFDSQSQIRLAGDPVYGTKVRLDDLDLSTTPATIEVLTADGHQGVVTVHEVSDGGFGAGFWELTLSSSFSL